MLWHAWHDTDGGIRRSPLQPMTPGASYLTCRGRCTSGPQEGLGLLASTAYPPQSGHVVRSRCRRPLN